MNILCTVASLETVTPALDTNPADINPGQPAPIYFTEQLWPGGTTLILAGPQYSAGLSKRVVTLYPGTSLFVLCYQIRPSQSSAVLSQCYEGDLMIVDAAGNRYNGSSQKNNEEGGMWQIAKVGGDWIDTGFKPGLWAPDAWASVSVAMEINQTEKTLSVLSITDGATQFPIPTALQNVPATPDSGWTPSIIQHQAQGCLNAPGCCLWDLRNISIGQQ